MAAHFGILAWRIPWTKEPGGLQGIAKSWTPLSDYHFCFYTLVKCKLLAVNQGKI